MKKWLILILGAVLYPLALAPFSSFWNMEISLAILLWTLDRLEGKQVFLAGWVYGTLAFAIGIHWLFYSLYEYGEISAWLSVLIVLIFAIYFGLVYGLYFKLFKTYFSRYSAGLRALFFFPLSLAILTFIPFPLFSFIGTTHINSYLRGYVPFLGEAILVFFIAQSGGAIYLFTKFDSVFWRLKAKLGLFIYLGGVWITGYYLDKLPTPTKDSIVVSALQLNLTPKQKWNPILIQEQFSNYLQSSLVDIQHTEFIVWPEAALPALTLDLVAFLQERVNILKTPILLGTLRNERGKFFNSATLIGEKLTHYDKRKLMPFGEYLPKWFEPLRQHFPALLGSCFSPGRSDQPLLRLYDLYPFAVNICYENIFPTLTWKCLPLAEFIVTISDDSWFKQGWVVAQHLATAQMLSLSSGRYQIFVSNGGICGFIDDHGRLLLQEKTRKTMVGTVKLRDDLPLHLRIRYPLLIVMLALLGLPLINIKKKNGT